MTTPDAWDDNWETAADKSFEAPLQKPVPAKVSKAQRRAQQAEFNRQLWQEAEGEAAEPNYFLQTRGIVPKADEFKPPPRLLSRKGPTSQSKGKNDSSDDDEGDDKKKELTVEEKRALAAKEREEKQRKYEERRQELFGTTTTTTTTGNSTNHVKSGSVTSSPTETPPGSRSATPNRGRGGRGGSRKTEPSRPVSSSASSLSLRPSSLGPTPAGRGEKKELFDPNYTPRKPDLTKSTERQENVVQPIRTPRGPDGSGRGGFGFAPRGGKLDT